jgi:hypothetical protein
VYLVGISGNATSFPGGCHRCLCPPANYLDTSKVFEAKTTARIKNKVLAAAGGAPGAQRPVAVFSNDGKTSREGPAASSYENARKNAGGHLVFNAFWLISSFCLYQMYMRDSLHQVDHGIIIHVMRAILRLFLGG